jgi:hypothetical protein
MRDVLPNDPAARVYGLIVLSLAVNLYIRRDELPTNLLRFILYPLPAAITILLYRQIEIGRIAELQAEIPPRTQQIFNEEMLVRFSFYMLIAISLNLSVISFIAISSNESRKLILFFSLIAANFILFSRFKNDLTYAPRPYRENTVDNQENEPVLDQPHQFLCTIL